MAPVASITTSQPWAIELVGRGGDSSRTEALGHRVAIRIGLDDVQAARAVVLHHLREQKTHRSGAIDQVLVGGLGAELVEAMHDARQGLDEGRPESGKVGIRLERACRLNPDQLGTGAVDGAHADCVSVLAEVEAAKAAHLAVAARDTGIRRHEVADPNVADG